MDVSEHRRAQSCRATRQPHTCEAVWTQGERPVPRDHSYAAIGEDLPNAAIVGVGLAKCAGIHVTVTLL